VHAEDAGDDVALRVHGRLFGRQAALAHHLGHQAVVGRDLVELAVGVAVAARVADVGDGQHLGRLVVDDRQRHDRRAHPGQLGILDPRVVDGGVGGLDRLDQAVDAAMDEGSAHGLAGDLAGDLAAVVTPHAVGDHPQVLVGPGDEVVLVQGPDPPDVGGAAPPERRAVGAGGHRCTLRANR
jgi:hypothetical protein